MRKSTEIGAYETKIRPAAELVPYVTSRRFARAEAACRMQSFMAKQKAIVSVDIKQLLDERRD